MPALQLVVLPVLFALFAAAAILWRIRTRRVAARLAGIAAAIVLDVWLWLIATAPPLGPHAVIAYLLVLVHVVLALVLVQDVSGFSVRTRGGRGRYRSVKRDDGQYDRYRAD